MISHLQREPELFWTIQHVSVYTGVSMVTSSGTICAILLVKNSTKGILKKGTNLALQVRDYLRPKILTMNLNNNSFKVS